MRLNSSRVAGRKGKRVCSSVLCHKPLASSKSIRDSKREACKGCSAPKSYFSSMGSKISRALAGADSGMSISFLYAGSCKGIVNVCLPQTSQQRRRIDRTHTQRSHPQGFPIQWGRHDIAYLYMHHLNDTLLLPWTP